MRADRRNVPCLNPSQSVRVNPAARTRVACLPGKQTSQSNQSSAVLFNGDQGGEIKTLKPDIHTVKARRAQTLAMGVQCFGNKYIIDSGAFLGDFQFTVALRALEVVVQLGHELLVRYILKHDFFGKD